MDYPISVPSVGLVGGKFADEDPLAGTPGSLIPAQWGNAVTDEILHVITVAGLTPDEAVNTQLATAISQIIGTARPLASQAEAEAGTDNSKMMTPLRTLQAILKRLPLSAPVIGGVRNLRCLVSATSPSATFIADEVIVKTALGGASYVLPAFNRTINISGTGVGGVDNGAAAANGFLGIYACFNPNIAVSPTNPMLIGQMEAAAVFTPAYSGLYMPAGYTASALVSVAPISGTAGQFAIFFQLDRYIDYLGVGVLTSSSAIVSGVPRGSPGFPYSAKFAGGFNQVGNSSAAAVSQILTATAVTTLGGQFSTCNVTAGSSQAVPFRVAIATPQTIFQTTSSSGGTASFTISVKNYEF